MSVIGIPPRSQAGCRSERSVPLAFLALQLFVDDALERIEWLRAVERSAVDEERRSARHARAIGLLDISVDHRGGPVRVDARVEARRIEAELDRMLLQVGCGQFVRIREQ